MYSDREIVSGYLVWMSCYRPFLFASVLTRCFDLVISGVSFSWWIPVVSGECLQQIYMVHCLQQMRVCVTHRHPTSQPTFRNSIYISLSKCVVVRRYAMNERERQPLAELNYFIRLYSMAYTCMVGAIV